MNTVSPESSALNRSGNSLIRKQKRNLPSLPPKQMKLRSPPKTNESYGIGLVAIGAGVVAHKLYESDQVINEHTYLLSYMSKAQLEECVNAYYNFEEVYGNQPDFINECVDAFFEISEDVWDTYESYITEGYDEDDTSIIEE